MAIRINKLDRAIVYITLPLVKAKSEKIMTIFLHDFFHDNPDMKKYCNMSLHKENSGQPKVIAEAVLHYARNLDDKNKLERMFYEISNIHVGLDVEPYMYPMLGDSLMGAVKKVLGILALPRIVKAWEKSYYDFADILIEREKVMYAEKLSELGGWNGKREFIVSKKVKECEDIISLYLKPSDEKQLPYFKAGQYITLGADVKGESHLHTRHYSLSDSPGKDYLRISVKREKPHDKELKGIVSNHIYDEVKEGNHFNVTMPSGIFTLKKEGDNPIVLLSAGVGITPLISMYKELSKIKVNRKVIFIHSSKNGKFHAFKKEADAIDLPNFSSYYIYTQPENNEKIGEDYHFKGYINEEMIFSTLNEDEGHKADYYLCGSKSFMKGALGALSKKGISNSQIHYEFFGSTNDLNEFTGVANFTGGCPFS